MELSKGKLENYQKNLRCIHEVTGELIGCMKGRHYSFLQEILDEKETSARRNCAVWWRSFSLSGLRRYRTVRIWIRSQENALLSPI